MHWDDDFFGVVFYMVHVEVAAYSFFFYIVVVYEDFDEFFPSYSFCNRITSFYCGMVLLLFYERCSCVLLCGCRVISMLGLVSATSCLLVTNEHRMNA